MGADDEGEVRGKKSGFMDAPFPYADSRVFSDSSTAREQHRSHNNSSPGSSSWRNTIAAYKFDG